MATIIKDIYGGTLRLSRTRLTELTGFIIQPFYLKLKDMRVSNCLCIYPTKRTFLRAGESVANPPDFYAWICIGPFGVERFKIGCRLFSKEVYNQILKAAKLPEVK